VFVTQGRILVEQLEPHADTDREVDVFPFIKRCALDIIAETAMDTQLNTQTGESAEYCEGVVTISKRIFEKMLMPFLWIQPIWYGIWYGFQFDRLVKQSQDFTLQIIRDRRRQMEDEGLLG
ncbi:hypothetical protein PENTCL1PPCAC_13852, partial [Pristionchus entomophagus]